MVAVPNMRDREWWQFKTRGIGSGGSSKHEEWGVVAVSNTSDREWWQFKTRGIGSGGSSKHEG